MKPRADRDSEGIRVEDREGAEDGLFEVTIRVRGATRVNRLLSWLVRSRAYDDVECMAVAFQGDRERTEPDQGECA